MRQNGDAADITYVISRFHFLDRVENPDALCHSPLAVNH